MSWMITVLQKVFFNVILLAKEEKKYSENLLKVHLMQKLLP